MYINDTVTIKIDATYAENILNLCMKQIRPNHITVICDHGTSMNEQQQKFLIYALEQTKIPKLTIGPHISIGDDFAKILVNKKCSLDELCVSNQRFTDEGFKLLFESQIFKSNLKVLKINDNHLIKGHVIFELLFKSSIQSVNISNNSLTLSDNKINIDENTLSECKIEFIDISGNQFKNADFLEIMRKLYWLPNLKELHVCNLAKINNLSSKTFIDGLSNLQNKINITKINISNNVIAKNDLEKLKTLFHNVEFVENNIITPEDCNLRNEQKKKCIIC